MDDYGFLQSWFAVFCAVLGTLIWRAAGVMLASRIPAAGLIMGWVNTMAYALVAELSTDKRSNDIFKFAAGGLRDFTRIASSDPRMWREILLANKDELATAIEDFEQQLALLKTLLDNEDGDALEMVFEDVKRSRDQFAAELAARSQS